MKIDFDILKPWAVIWRHFWASVYVTVCTGFSNKSAQCETGVRCQSVKQFSTDCQQCGVVLLSSRIYGPTNNRLYYTMYSLITKFKFYFVLFLCSSLFCLICTHCANVVPTFGRHDRVWQGVSRCDRVTGCVEHKPDLTSALYALNNCHSVFCTLSKNAYKYFFGPYCETNNKCTAPD